jgi:hypothetical protein
VALEVTVSDSVDLRVVGSESVSSRGPDFHYTRRSNGVLGQVTEFEVYSAPDESEFQVRPLGGTRDADWEKLRAEQITGQPVGVGCFAD